MTLKDFSSLVCSVKKIKYIYKNCDINYDFIQKVYNFLSIGFILIWKLIKFLKKMPLLGEKAYLPFHICGSVRISLKKIVVKMLSSRIYSFAIRDVEN